MTVDEMESAANDLLGTGSHSFLSNTTDPAALYSDEEPIRTGRDEDELADEMTCVTSFWWVEALTHKGENQHRYQWLAGHLANQTTRQKRELGNLSMQLTDKIFYQWEEIK